MGMDMDIKAFYYDEQWTGDNDNRRQQETGDKRQQWKWNHTKEPWSKASSENPLDNRELSLL